MNGETVVFWLLAPVAVVASLGMLVTRKAVYSALFLALTMVCLAVFYVVQDAPFLGVVQVVVYTGAVMMLFLFVLMLVGVDASDSLVETLRGQRWAAAAAGLGFGMLLIGAIGDAVVDDPVGLADANRAGNIQGVGELIFTRYVFAFEVTSALLITAAVGAMVLAHVEKAPGERISQRERSRERFAPGVYPAPKPGPGVYATADSVATPAVLPDGRTADESVPRSIEQVDLDDSSRSPK